MTQKRYYILTRNAGLFRDTILVYTHPSYFAGKMGKLLAKELGTGWTKSIKGDDKYEYNLKHYDDHEEISFEAATAILMGVQP
jgi:hypothetical protein